MAFYLKIFNPNQSILQTTAFWTWEKDIQIMLQSALDRGWMEDDVTNDLILRLLHSLLH